MSTIDTENRLGLSFCERLELAFTHGKGTRVWDEAGKAYLDFTSGWGVNCLGHAHPAITSALTAQAARIMQSPNSLFTYSPERADLLALLHSVLPHTLVRTFFCNSGAEANDAALKLARKITGRSKVISTVGGFHGRSFNTLSVTRGVDNTSRYLPVMPGTRFVPHGDVAAVGSIIDDETAAVIVEPVQSEGGVQVPPPTYLSEVQALCRQHGVLLIVDEVQTGFCRTGKFFAVEHSPTPVEPNIMTMGKGIAGGFPFAAFSVSASVAARLGRDDHGGTYCGNPLGCAVSREVISYLREQRVAERAASSGELLLAGLRDLQQQFPALLCAVRGIGLLCALQFSEHAHSRLVTRLCAERGLLVVPTRNGVVRLVPDLLVTQADIEAALAVLRGVLSGMQGGFAV